MTLSLEWTSDDGRDHVMRFDAVVSELHDLAGEVTEHAVEGRAIADHVIPGAQRIAIDGVVSGTPVSAVQPTGGAVEEPRGSTQTTDGDIVAVSFEDLASEVDRLQDVVQVLQALTGSPQLITVASSTGLTLYEDMVLRTLAVSRDRAAEEVRVSMELTQVRIVETSTVTVTEPQEPRGNARANAGAQETRSSSEDEPTIAEEDTDDRSALARMEDDGIGGLIGGIFGG